ncbi:MAG TPA: CapA family protein [Spirochaetota bacterium]|nr:CapA family protein [Spirochaetota bacterium]HRT77080.1 CapA family protein [Spirochaetota bacterium]
MKRIIYIFIILSLMGGAVCIGIDKLSARSAQRFSILFVGDILLANEAEQHIHKKGIEYPFWKIKEELLKYDFIFANMESPITKRGTPVVEKPYIFRVKPEDAVCLKDLKIDAVSISNNHLMDYNTEGMVDTIAALDRLNIRHTGGGKNLDEARRPVVLKYGDTSIVILAYCNRPPEEYYATDSLPGIAPLDLDLIREDIAAYKLDNSRVLISLHWGIEQTHVPQKEQIATAHDIIDAGADAIIGHHPHWPQGIEIYRGRPIIYSLGNFINGYINPVERDNIAVGFYYNGGTLETIKVIPLAGRNRQIRFQPFVLTGKHADGFLYLIRNLSRGLKTEMNIINGYGYIDPGQNRVAETIGGISGKSRLKATRPVTAPNSTLKTGSR